MILLRQGAGVAMLAWTIGPRSLVFAAPVQSPAVREAFSREPVLVEPDDDLRVYAGE